jgi:hypothetical protein
MSIKRFVIQIVVIALLLLAAGLWVGSAANAADQTSQQLWRDVDEASMVSDADRQIIPTRYRTVAADLSALAALLASAPPENTADRTDAVLLPLPLPDGTIGRFLIQEYAMMEPELAAKFPEIKTYLGQGVDDPAATVRIDRTPAGFHAMILSSTDSIFIDPYRRGDVIHYISYYKRDFVPSPDSLMTEMMEYDPDAASRLPNLENLVLPPSGSQLRTYRTVVAATGEYTQFHGGTVNAGLAAIVTSVNRVTGIYERDVAIRLVLVANNNLVVYTNAATDPYTNSSGSTMLSQNQSNLDVVIGSANYDFGHVFSTGGGGIASLGVTCRAGLKARGVTGQSQPVGDPFDIDYVAHEMGHQFGANHTFNGTTSSCGGGNRNSSTAYEPGSGSSIMAYAGICGAEDLQPNSDAMFHVASFDEIVAYSTVGQGNSCAAITNTGNTPPTVDAGANFTIPQQTFFTLTGSASDPDGDTLTYSWEQFNLGTASPPNTDNGNRPIFREFLPVSSPARTFPRWFDILNNVSTLGESLPTTNRTLTFRLVVRDNRASGGGVNYDTASVTVTTSSGPFLVTAPNTPVSWPGGSNQTVTWNVANTTLAPVSCANVNIFLSTDGGNSFPTSLASNTPNDGSQSVTVPNVATTTARVKVNCANNIFFDVSNTNFTITAGATSTPTATATGTATATATGTSTATPTATSTPPPGGDVFFDNFETNLGWTVNPNSNDTATSGVWERGNPEDTSDRNGPKQLGTTVSGSNDLVTGASAGSGVGANDLDGGVSSIQSPLINLPGGTLTLSFSYYLAHNNASSSADYLRVSVVGSSTTMVLEELGAANNDNGVWAAHSINISSFAGQTVRIRIEAADASGDSVLEAAVDDVRIVSGGGGPPPPPTATASSGNTGFLPPSANAAAAGGDGDGFEMVPVNGYAADNSYARDINSGTDTSTSCTAASKDKHLYYNYNFSIPGAPTIDGIEVQLDARTDGTTGAPAICVQLSWDGGATWTAPQATTMLNTTEATYIVGGAANTWGRTWSPGEFSNSNFRVRLIQVAASTTRDFAIDYIAVRVHY